MAESSLREQYKSATRLALSRAAVRLALRDGLENVRVPDIAAEAGVSTRTFNNYFSSKEEAIVALGVDRAERIAAALRDRPATEPLGDALLAAVVGHWSAAAGRAGNDDDDWRTRMSLLVSTPALQGEYLKAVTAMERPLAEAIAARAGLPGPGLPERALAAAVAAAERVAITHWLTVPHATSLPEALRQATAQAISGYRTPSEDQR
ncbi:MAG: TetR/AcrR family transcriptional regulator [Mycobacteriales bacterium]